MACRHNTINLTRVGHVIKIIQVGANDRLTGSVHNHAHSGLTALNIVHINKLCLKKIPSIYVTCY